MPNWNKSQQEVLDSLKDECNVLVSAAAGSGKTAVLVERIIRTVQQGLADIDEILVCTFTRAAAAQMKTKIIKQFEKLASVDSDSDNRFARQLTLAQSADIMTIDSFCNKVVRENFSMAGMDPAFEIYDSDEVSLLKDDILDEVLDYHYRDDEGFCRLAGFLMNRSIDDSGIKKRIMDIYSVSESYAYPEGWLASSRVYVPDKRKSKEELDKELREYISKQKWVKDYISYFKNLATECIHILEKRREFFEVPATDEKEKLNIKMLEMYDDDLDRLRIVAKSETLENMKSVVSPRWKNFQNQKFKDVYGEELWALLKDERDAIKDGIKNIYSEEDIMSDILDSGEYINCLIDIIFEFRNRLREEKDKLKKYEFADIAHATFKILYDVEEDAPTAVGKRMSEIYKYIYIDEYQDSNDLQENILNAVARRKDGVISNVFMVGDVKQSIYRFRLARPDLFNYKSEKYQEGVGGKLINLNMNYRSRAQVLDATNYLFRTLMTKEFGGIEYSSDVELHVPDAMAYNSNFPKLSDDTVQDNKTELIEIDISRDEDQENESAAQSYTPNEVEAVEIGRRIKELVEGNPAENKDKFYIVNEHFDSKKPESERNQRYRPVKYGDIVILQRKVRGMTRMVRIYEQMGIPVMLEDSSGYFDAMEISTMISVLRIIDNVQQDIPFASVLLSHIGGLSDTDLARIESLSVDRRMSLADKCRLFEAGYLNSEHTELKEVAEKLHRLSEMTERWRSLRPYISIAELIDKILQDTNYETFVAAMPEGERRLGNLKIFRVRAEKFESVRNAGLLDYLKYIDKCRLHDIDYSEAKVNVEAGNAVRIMSIHKSKGLEFPVVFVSTTGGQFMLRDMSGTIAVDSDYKIGMDNFWYLDNGIMVRTGNVKKDIMKVLNENAVKTEEARLLYVAMTRAKEKLIITGTYDKNPVPIVGLSKSLLDYVRYVIANNENEEINVISKTKNEIIEDFTKRYIKKSMDYTSDTEKLLAMISTEMKNDIVSGTDNPYSYIYPYEFQTGAKAKMSVSEIKHQEMENHMVIEDTTDVIETDGVAEEITEAEECEESRRKAALRGTIIHYLFEKLDYSKVNSKEELKEHFEDILKASIYSEEEKSLVKTSYLTRFYSEDEDSLFMRMKRSFMNDKLFREKQFIAGLGLDEIPGYDISQLQNSGDEDYTVIQGIIDAYFYQDDGSIILVDYKTDNVDEPEELIDRYGAQMYLYALTLEKLTSSRVEDVVLYSTRHGEVHYTRWREYIHGK
ncbi:MAG: UvrD-helicase domain-containing protein [Eubacterium sp.]|nr:UvrD-helicase domain-containing protein [Eubacterium sp.]